MPDRRRFVRSPDTLLVLAICAVVPAVLALLRSPPGTLERMVGLPLGVAWCVIVAASGTVGLCGVLTRDNLRGWLLELAGRVGLTLTMLGYAITLGVSVVNAGTTLVLGFVAAVTLSSGWRVWQLCRRLRTWREAIRGVGST